MRPRRSGVIEAVRNGIIQDQRGKAGGTVPRGERTTYVGRGDGDLDIVDAIEFDTGWRLIVVAGTADDEEAHAADDITPAMPGSDFGERIRADQEVKFVTG